MKNEARLNRETTFQDIDDGVVHVIPDIPRNPSIQVIGTRADIFDFKVTFTISLSPKLITLFMKRRNKIKLKKWLQVFFQND